MKPISSNLNLNYDVMNNFGNKDEHVSSIDSKETDLSKKKYYKKYLKEVNKDRFLKEEMTSAKGLSVKASLILAKKGDVEELFLMKNLLNGHVIVEDVKRLRNKRQTRRGRPNPKHKRNRIKKFRPSPLIYG